MIQNIFEDLSYCQDREIPSSLFEGKGVRVERIASYGQVSPVYDQDEEEWVLLLEGRAEILLLDEGVKIELKRGDSLYLAAGRRHQVTYTSSPCLWLCVFWKA